MSQVTKTLESKVGSIGVSADGASVSVNLLWTEPSPGPKRTPAALASPITVPVRITGGRAFRIPVDLGEAPPEILELAKKLSTSVTAFINRLVTQDRLNP